MRWPEQHLLTRPRPPIADRLALIFRRVLGIVDKGWQNYKRATAFGRDPEAGFLTRILNWPTWPGRRSVGSHVGVEIMKNVLVLGAGKIGTLLGGLLARTGDYQVHLADQDEQAVHRVAATFPGSAIHPLVLDASEAKPLAETAARLKVDALVSSLPFYCNVNVARVARQLNCHYFDLTEDVSVTDAVTEISQGASSAFVPQCGLAPGFISIVANDLMTRFDRLEEAKLRVGALPQFPSNSLKYALTWSSDGLINEYGNSCRGILDGRDSDLLPLEGLESIELEGRRYEAFNTSGGLGSLSQTYRGKINALTYKTIRYPGHCELVRFLMNDLGLNRDRATLKSILEKAIPRTEQDVVLIYVNVTGYRGRAFYEETYVNSVYPDRVGEQLWSAIQITTAAGICAVIDLVFASNCRGLILQEHFSLKEFLNNRFGAYYRQDRKSSLHG